MLSPNGRVIMISGANRGIGFATAKVLGAAGYRLSLGARDPATIDTEAIGAESMTHHWEASDADTSTAWTQATLDRYSQIDAVMLNAGVILTTGLESGTEADMDTMLDVNFKGPWRLIRAAMPSLRASGRGRVINVVSLAGKRLLHEQNFGYTASKFAALSLTHAIRSSGWQDGVRATAICPGMVDTDMVADINTPEGQFKISPQAIAASAAYALSLPNDAVVAELLINSRLEPSF